MSICIRPFLLSTKQRKGSYSLPKADKIFCRRKFAYGWMLICNAVQLQRNNLLLFPPRTQPTYRHEGTLPNFFNSFKQIRQSCITVQLFDLTERYFTEQIRRVKDIRLESVCPLVSGRISYLTEQCFVLLSAFLCGLLPSIAFVRLWSQRVIIISAFPDFEKGQIQT